VKRAAVWVALLLGVNLVLGWGLVRQSRQIEVMPVLVPEFAPAGLASPAAWDWPALLTALRELQQEPNLQLTQEQRQELQALLSRARLAREQVVRRKNAIHGFNTTIIKCGGRVLQLLTPAQRDYVVNNRDAVQWQVNEEPLWRSWESPAKP
jgi:hypothetical protein